MTKIAIIGAGLSGRLLALNLARKGTSAVSIRMIDRGDTRYMGPAYSNEADYLLLNVRAGQMGAFSEDPEHFLTWAQERGARAGRSDFLPRRLFRDYILDLMADAWQARTNGPLFEHVRGEVTDIETKGGCATIHVEAQEPFVVDRVILALGNFPPRHPLIENGVALQNCQPWKACQFSSTQFSFTIPGGCHVPSPGGKIEGGVSFGQYRRIITYMGPSGAGSQLDSLSLPGESFSM